MKILKIYLIVIWTFAGLVNIESLVEKEDMNYKSITLISLLLMILPTLFYILKS